MEKKVQDKKIEGVKFSRIDWKEGGLFSANREYLRVKRKNLVFDICGAPFGNGFFVSWWLGEIPSGCAAILMNIPVIGFWFERFVQPLTFYKIDTAMMFQSLVHSGVLEVVDELIKSNGLRALEREDRKPVMKGFFGL